MKWIFSHLIVALHFLALLIVYSSSIDSLFPSNIIKLKMKKLSHSLVSLSWGLVVSHTQTELCLASDSGAQMHRPQTLVFSVVSILLRENSREFEHLIFWEELTSSLYMYKLAWAAVQGECNYGCPMHQCPKVGTVARSPMEGVKIWF